MQDNTSNSHWPNVRVKETWLNFEVALVTLDADQEPSEADERKFTEVSATFWETLRKSVVPQLQAGATEFGLTWDLCDDDGCLTLVPQGDKKIVVYPFSFYWEGNAQTAPVTKEQVQELVASYAQQAGLTVVKVSLQETCIFPRNTTLVDNS